MSETRFNLNAFAAKWLRTSHRNLAVTRSCGSRRLRSQPQHNEIVQVRSGASRPFVRFGRPCRTKSPEACGTDFVAARKRCSMGRCAPNDVTELRIVAAMLELPAWTKRRP